MSAADVDNRGVPIFSPTFNLEDGAAQIHLANACADLMNRTDIRPSPASRCIMEAFRRSHQHLGLPFPSTSIVRDLIAWLKSNGDNWYEDVGFELKQKVDAHPSKIVKGRPLSREHHSLSFSALAQHGSLHSEERILNAASEYRVSYIRGTVLTYIDKSLGGVQMKPNYDRWEDWMDGWNARAPAMAGPGFQASGEWSRMRVELAFISGTISSISISVATVAVTILVFTHNAWLMLFTVGCILCIVACLLGLFVVWGWSLGALEAISVPLVVGLSVDYALHLGHSYNHAGSADPDDPTHKPSFDRVARMRAALIQIGPSVVSAAATTIGAMFVLYFCQIHVFKEIGIIVSVTLLLGIYFSICVFSALCFMFGPEGDQGNVIGWMRNARKWAEDKWNERKENHRRVQSDSPAAETMAAEPEYTRERMEA